jgi:hypothetical protein
MSVYNIFVGKVVKFDLVNQVVDQAMADDLKRAGWNFDWCNVRDSISENERIIRKALYYQDELQGLVGFSREPDELFNFMYDLESAPHNIGRLKIYENVAGILLASVAQDSLDHGFDGFVVFEAKTILVNHYIMKYGATPSGGQRLFFDDKASMNLISKYEEFVNVS